MSHTPHELSEEFPEHADKIHAMKTSDTHFAKMAEDYHTLNRAVHRAETDVEPTSDDVITDMRKERLQLKDKIAVYLSA